MNHGHDLYEESFRPSSEPFNIRLFSKFFRKKSFVEGTKRDTLSGNYFNKAKERKTQNGRNIVTVQF